MIKLIFLDFSVLTVKPDSSRGSHYRLSLIGIRISGRFVV